MIDASVSEDRIERSERTMRRWVSMDEETFVESMNKKCSERDVSIPHCNCIRDIELLEEYMNCIDEYLTEEKGYNRKLQAERRIQFLEWPQDGWKVSKGEIEYIEDLDIPHLFPSRFEADFSDWENVFYYYDIEQMKFISKTIRLKNSLSLGRKPRRFKVLDFFRYVKGDKRVEIGDS